MPVTRHSSKPDLLAIWKQVRQRLDKMSAQERTQTLVEAGILTSKGNLRKPYKDLSGAVRLKADSRQPR
jgi:hypothetical protein